MAKLKLPKTQNSRPIFNISIFKTTPFSKCSR